MYSTALKEKARGYLQTHNRRTLLKLLHPALESHASSNKEILRLTSIGQLVGLSSSEVGFLDQYSRGKLAVYCSTVLLIIIIGIILIFVTTTMLPANTTTYIAGTRYGSIAPKDFGESR